MENAPLDLREVFRVLWRRKVLLFVPWALAVLVGMLAAFLIRPVYFSSVTLVLQGPQAMSGKLGEMSGGRDPEQQVEVARQQIGSGRFLQTVIDATGAARDPEVRKRALEQARKDPALDEDRRVEAFLLDELRRAVAIRRGRSNLLEVVVGDPRPEWAQKFANAVADQFVLASKARQIEALTATHEFSIEQQQVFRKRLEESEARLAEFRSGGGRARRLRPATGSAARGAAVAPGALIERADAAVREQRQRVAALRRQIPNPVSERDASRLTTADSDKFEGQLDALERQLAGLLYAPDGSGADAATRQAIVRKLSELELEFMQNAAAALPNASPEDRDLLVRLRLAQADLASREAHRAQLGAAGADAAAATPAPAAANDGAPVDRATELQRLETEVETNRAVYQSFLQQASASQIAEAFEAAKISGRFEVVEPAPLPRAPGRPNRPLLILLAFVVGGMIGVGSVMVVEQHDQSMRNAQEVENLLGLPVLGAVPRVDELERSRRRSRTASATATPAVAAAARDTGLLQRLKVESPLGLEFRRIYLKLAKSRGRALPSTILVTSSTRAEGKTTTSACLGITLARELREKVLLVDFDLRSPALHRALGLPASSWGLAQMLAQRKFDERFVRSTVLPTLDFLAAGKSERPASELIDTEAVEWFLREARTRYAVVLMDAAPNLAVPDPLILGRSVEGVIYVIKAGSTIRKAAEYGVKVQREARDNLLGVLLNDAGEILPHYYGYHDAYGEAAGGEI